MRVPEIEVWTIAVVDRAVAGRPNEDARVELKATWPGDHARAARRIAGHANAARGDTVLWVIGVDEKARTVPGAGRNELADWYAKVGAQFDALPPAVTDVVVPTAHGTVVALVFDTSRAPFVVRNAAHGSAGQVVEREVPWREATRVRSARRDDLLQLLVPLQRVPATELLGASVTLREETYRQEDGRDAAAHSWRVELVLYVMPRADERIVIPFHTTELEVTLPGLSPPLRAPEVRIGPVANPHGGAAASPFVVGSTSEVIFHGPGVAVVTAPFLTPTAYLYLDRPVRVRAKLAPAFAAGAIEFDIDIPARTALAPSEHRWSTQETYRLPLGPGGKVLPQFVR